MLRYTRWITLFLFCMLLGIDTPCTNHIRVVRGRPHLEQATTFQPLLSTNPPDDYLTNWIDESEEEERWDSVVVDGETSKRRLTVGSGGEIKGLPMGWVDPNLKGGQMLDFTLPGKGEPLNVIISGLSDPYILTPKGLLHWAQTIGFSSECFGLHLGQLHIANLGDGMGNRTEQLLARENFDWPAKGWPDWGTCWESLVGGNHFRAWKQEGALARTGAWFLAVSSEHWMGRHHDIIPNGYNIGRDSLVGRAIIGNTPTSGYPFQSIPGYIWKADVKWVEAGVLLQAGRKGVNHRIKQDGRVAVLTVRRIGLKDKDDDDNNDGGDGNGGDKDDKGDDKKDLKDGKNRKEEVVNAWRFWQKVLNILKAAILKIPWFD